MKSSSTVAPNIDAYIRAFPPPVRARLSSLRSTILEHAPGAVEKISYRMPTFHLNGNLVHFAAFERHIGFYPGPSGIARFQKEMTGYRSSKGAVQFPHDEPLPLDLVARIVTFRVKEATGGADARG